MPETEQLTMFDMPEVEESTNGFTLGQQTIPQEIIDEILSSGTNREMDTLRICAKFSHDKPLAENVEFLRDIYGTDGKGFVIDGRRVSMWTDEAGMNIAYGNTAQIAGAVHLSWVEVAERVCGLLDAGKYISQAEIDYVKAFEFRELGERLWLAYRDDLGAFPDEWEIPVGFPEGSAKLGKMLAVPGTRDTVYQQFRQDINTYEAEHPKRRVWHNYQKLMEVIADLEHTPLEFQSSRESIALERFITQDEIDSVFMLRLKEGSGQRIAAFFQEPHTPQEREQFLKREYGIGGYGTSKIDVNYDGKGIRIVRGDLLSPEAETRVNWRQAAERIRVLIREGKYSQKEAETEPPAPVMEESHAGEAPRSSPAEEIKFEPSDEGLLAKDNAGITLAHIHDDGSISYPNPDLSVEVIDKITIEAQNYWYRIEDGKTTADMDTEIPPKDESQPEVKLNTIVIDLTPRQPEIVPDFMPEEEPTAETEPSPGAAPASNYRIHDDHLGEGGTRTKADRNIEAIRTLAQIERENRTATPEEQEVLAQYVGWGGIPQIFDENNSEWSARRDSLKELLNETEYASARASTLNAHYTSPVVIRSMYQALENMGFETGNVLEPSCGVGNFFGALPENMDSSRLFGVELDSVTGRIAKQLYPNANIQVQGFETTQFPDNFFDVAVGNVPFGAYKLPDKRYDRHSLQIHDYFFYKTLDKVRPGGVIAFVTSKGTLDKQDSAVRKYIAERADLLGAVRLPNNAFLKNANTEVTTDIIFLQKREEPNLTEPSWVNVGKTEDGVPVNQYFLDHPEMMLGTMRFDKSMYGNERETTCDPIEGISLEERLKEAVSNIRGDYQKIEMGELEQDEEILPADPNMPDYSFGRIDGKLYFRENSVMKRVHVPAKAEKRIDAMIELRDAIRELLNAQLENRPDAEIEELQKQLNEKYDAFVEEYGRLSSRANAQAFDTDDGYYLLTSLEVLDDERNFERKADLFTKRTIRPSEIPDHVDTAQEALILSMSERGRVDFNYMTALTGKDPDEIIMDLHGLIFQDPQGNPGLYEQWQTADEYLSGNVRDKLVAAKAAEELYPGTYAANVAALEEVQPKDLEPHEIDVRLGATWIPAHDVQRFMHELLQTGYWNARQIRVNYCEQTATWNVTNKSVDYANVRANTQYGTSRVNAYKLIEESLNLRDVKIFDMITDPDGNEKRVLNQKETILAQQKQTAIREAFKDWIWKDPQRRERLCRVYNDRFNNIRLRQYDGSNLSFNGLNPEVTLRPHQKDAVARILYGGNSLLAHVVGAGKTAVMVSGIMEKKRLGLAQKALVAVPNHLTQQTAAEFLRFYPAAKVLVATKKDFEKANRKRFIAKIATGDYDAIIMGHSQFEKVPVSKERQEAMLQEQIDEIVAGIEEVKMNNGERFTIKQLERTRKSLEARLKKLNSDENKDQVINFEQLGVDMLVVDEAHSFKNCAIVTKMRNVAGIQTTEAKKSSDMLMKCRYISEKTGNSGVVFATGTPISNSMVEMYNMQRYLQNDLLKERGVAQFDQWASTFGETQTAIELAPEGTGYRSKTRFSKFFNLPELISMFRMTADVQTADMLKLPVPELKGGQVQNIRTEPSEFQREAVAMLGERAEKVRKGTVDPREDNMLKITNDGRMLALDARLIDPNQPDDPNSKVNACVQNVLRIYKEGAEQRTTQLIFSDLSTPRNDGEFDIYNDIKKKLMEHGVPEDEIAFIHDANNDAQKEALFSRVRSGNVRVLIGSTPRMGAGTNVQQRLIALHHLDVPWRPSDLQQREGRILRQGNQNPEVEIYRYVTENTFDAYSYQLVESKQKFIAQVFTSKTPVRGAEDTDEVALSYAEVKALAAGNPLIKEKMDLDVQVAKLRLLKSNFTSEQYHLEHQVRTEFPTKIAQAKERIVNYQEDIRRYNEHFNLESFSIEFMNHHFEKRADAAEYLGKLAKLQKTGESVRIGSLCGFELYLEKKTFTNELVVEMRGKNRYHASLGESDIGNITRIENVLKDLPEAEKQWHGKVAEYERQLVAAKENLEKPFPQEEELKRASARLVELNAELDVGGSPAGAAALDDGDDHNAPGREREPNRQKQNKEAR